MDTPIPFSKTVTAPPPSKLFFGGLDIPEGNVRNSIVSTRSAAVQRLHRRKDQVGLSLAHLRPADEVGLTMNSVQVLLAVVDRLHTEAHQLADLIAKADDRWTRDYAADIEPRPAPARGGVVGELIDAATPKPSDVRLPAGKRRSAYYNRPMGPEA